MKDESGAKKKRSEEIRVNLKNYGKKVQVLVTAIVLFEMNKRTKVFKYHFFCY